MADPSAVPELHAFIHCVWDALQSLHMAFDQLPPMWHPDHSQVGRHLRLQWTSVDQFFVVIMQNHIHPVIWKLRMMKGYQLTRQYL